MLEIISNFSNIILEVKIEKYVEEYSKYAFKAKNQILDNSILIIRDYRFENGDRKYSFHWMDEANSLKIRWDNEPHWHKLSTFPHHKHIETNDNVFPSIEISLDQVLKFITTKLLF